MDTADETSAVPPPASSRRPKGQRMVTWDDPGEWTYDTVKRLRYCRRSLGVDEEGAATTILVVQYEPGSQVGAHFHGTDYCSIVVQGSIEVTRRDHHVGTMRFVNAETAYGPLRAGPEGCTVIDVFATGRGDSSKVATTTYL
jgi:hypothetical protein